MAIKRHIPPSDRISATLLKELADSAERLNAGSDELGKAIRPIDAALKKLNLGVAAWLKYAGNDWEEPDFNGSYSCRRIGYAKVGGKWGLALSTDSGNIHAEVDHEEEWLFNDAPRGMRLEALDYIPDLLDHLVKEANKVAEDLQCLHSSGVDSCARSHLYPVVAKLAWLGWSQAASWNVSL